MSTKPPSGTRDFLPDDVRRREYVIGVVREVYERYGFEPLETPAFENIETLLGKYGEEGNKLIFKILERGEHEASGEADLALRYDLTVPLARVVAAVSERPAAVLQALPDSAGMAGRSAGARTVPRVLPVRYRRDRLDVAGGRGGVLAAVCRDPDAPRVPGLRHSLNHRRRADGAARQRRLPPAQHGDALVALDKLDKIGRDGVAKEFAGGGIVRGGSARRR